MLSGSVSLYCAYYKIFCKSPENLTMFERRENKCLKGYTSGSRQGKKLEGSEDTEIFLYMYVVNYSQYFRRSDVVSETKKI